MNRSKKWSASERAQLLALVDERNAVEEGRWNEVAEALGVRSSVLSAPVF